MAKINHNNSLHTIDGSIENAKKNNAIHHYAEDAFLKGGHLKINGANLWHFANTGYLGLEQDYRLKQAAADAIFNYGTQFPLSKTYVSHPLYSELEELLGRIYNNQALIVTKNSTLAHMGAIPHVVDYNDMVILDHQVHWSVQNACNVLKNKGIPIQMIRHNAIKQLEMLIANNINRYEKIWYMADGIYSMYGDTLPVDEIKRLMHKYKNFYLYVDDVHGMSWQGVNGSGFVSSHWPSLNQRMLLVTTLSKTFGASGALILSGNTDLIAKIKNFGGPLTFSAQLEPASVAAAIASAKIHLTDEIYTLQNALHTKINLFYNELMKANIPLVSDGKSPVFYVPTASPETAYYLVNTLAKDGFYVNPGLFPAVPVNNAGLRITICNHNANEQIIDLVKSLVNHYPKALSLSFNSIKKISRAFKMDFVDAFNTHKISDTKYKIQIYHSISYFESTQWNAQLHDQAFDYAGFQFIEHYFSKLPKEDPNAMKFNYFVVQNSNGEIEAFTQTSVSLWKEDMLAHETVSAKIEKIRQVNPLFLTEMVMSTGSVFSEGTHVFINPNSKQNKILHQMFFECLENEFDQTDSGKLVLRDFIQNNAFDEVMKGRGYVTVEMPESAVFSNFNWKDPYDFDTILSKRSKRHFKEEVLPFVDLYDVEIQQKVNASDLPRLYKLYLNVKENNLAINNFPYRFDLFVAMNQSPLWEFLLLKNKTDLSIVGVMFCYKNKTNNSLNPILIGMADDVSDRLLLYRQLLFQTIIQAKNNGFSKIYFGLSAIFEKRKLGAAIFKKSAYVRMKDSYKIDLLQSFE